MASSCSVMHYALASILNTRLVGIILKIDSYTVRLENNYTIYSYTLLLLTGNTIIIIFQL